MGGIDYWQPCTLLLHLHLHNPHLHQTVVTGTLLRFSPNNQNPIIVSAGWDKYVKVWNLTNCKLKTNHIGHSGVCRRLLTAVFGRISPLLPRLPQHCDHEP